MAKFKSNQYVKLFDISYIILDIEYQDYNQEMPINYLVYNLNAGILESINHTTMNIHGELDNTAKLLYEKDCQQNAIHLYNTYTAHYPSTKK